MQYYNDLTESFGSFQSAAAGVFSGPAGGKQSGESIEAISAAILPLVLATILQQRFSPKTTSSIRKKYDYIIVGGGTAGSVLASRLSEKPCVEVLLLEAAGSPTEMSEIPGLALLEKLTDLNWNFQTEPQKYTAEGHYQNRIPYDLGKGLGGSSIISTMISSRGNKQDFIDWVALGAKGWGPAEVRRYFRKVEDNADPDIASNRKCHNVGGPVTFSKVRYTSPFKNPLLEAAESYGYPVVDTNCEHQLGFSEFQALIRRGQRCSAAKAYLVPADDRPNLDIVTQATVTKIEIKNGVAQGVCFLYKGSSRHCVKAKREVILSAGAINSVKVLMLSGIGPRETLRKLRIKEKANLPVGKNLQDHPTSAVFFKTPGLRALERLTSPSVIHEYISNRSGPLATPGGIFANGYHRSKGAGTPKGVPNFGTYFMEADSAYVKNGFGVRPEVYQSLFGPYEKGGVLFCVCSVLQPKGRGYVTINSTDPLAPPIINPNFLSHKEDVKDLVKGLEFCLKLATTEEMQDAGVEYFDTKILGCEKYDSYSPEYLKCYVRTLIMTIWHPACTVKMGGKHDRTAVLDPEFRVKGIKGLRVIDASAMPKLVSGDTMVTVMMMAEKGADMIKEHIRCK